MSTQLTILHFNDCYNVEPGFQEPVGGAARFVHALQSYYDKNSLVLFSGDIISPSLLSTFTKGQQMLPVLDKCKIDCALYGNHEFDFGLEYLISFVQKTNFPWLMSNVYFKETQRPLAEGKLTHIIEKNGIKIGLIGLIEDEWLSSLVIDIAEIHYIDFISEGRRLARMLKEQENVDLVIALTHMRTQNDTRLAENVTEIDLILGGHDHIYFQNKINGRYVIKSGTDFRQFSKIDLRFEGKQLVDVQIEEINVTSDLAEDSELNLELEKYKGQMEEQMDVILAQLECDMDGKFSSIRSQESNLGNWITDVMLELVREADFALLNGGTLRSDTIHPKGYFKMRDLVRIIPYAESILVLNITGHQIHRALENGVSQYPKLDGRFPHVSGLTYAFDPSKEPGKRVKFENIKMHGEPLEPERVYRMVTKEFIAAGKDGYEVFKECPIYRNADECLPLLQAVQQHIEAMRIVQIATHKSGQLKANLGSGHRTNIVNLSQRLTKHLDRSLLLTDYLCHLNPQVEGRIVILS